MTSLESLYVELADSVRSDWADRLRSSAITIMDPAKNGHMRKWLNALRDLPDFTVTHTDFASPVVTFDGDCSDKQRSRLRESLRAFYPWRKGPFDLFGVEIDAEWRSDQKWLRVAPHVDLSDKDVLDVGCGNGYYGWRMLGAGARRIVGLEPYPLYNMQHRLIKTFASNAANFVVPATDRVLTANLELFDVAFSMGVLYHCKNPIGHIESLRQSLKSGGEVVLETLVVDGNEQTALIPEDRYAKMRNVWLIPSALMLVRLLHRAGLRQIEVVDVTQTTPAEQRSTDWMRFESLQDFLDPNDSMRTIEGLAAPKRAVIVARKP